MNHMGPRVSREKALEILKSEAKPSWISRNLLLIFFVPIGYLASTYGEAYFGLFIGFAICLGVIEYRNSQKRSHLAVAVLALLSENDKTANTDKSQEPQTATAETNETTN